MINTINLINDLIVFIILNTLIVYENTLKGTPVDINMIFIRINRKDC